MKLKNSPKIFVVAIVAITLLLNLCAISYAAEPVAGAIGGGVGGGGGAPAGFNAFIFNPDGSEITDVLTEGEAVRLTIQATLLTKPGAVYAVAVYNADGSLKNAGLYNSTASALYEHEFLELDTTYDTSATIKVMTFESSDNIKPLRKSVNLSFYACEYSIPEEEVETDGITAYRGIANVHPAIISLTPTHIRSNGYWYAPVENTPIQVYYSNYDPWFRTLYGYNAYNIKNINGKYILDSIDSDVEFIEFTCDDVVSASSTNLITVRDGTETEYSISSTCEFFEDGNPIYSMITPDFYTYSDTLYTAMVSNGEIRGISALYNDSIVGNVTLSNKESIIMDNGLSLATDGCYFVNGIPSAGDIVEIFKGYTPTVIKSEAVSAILTEDGIITNDKVYPFPEKSEAALYVPDEKCTAYMSYDGTNVIYIKKDYSAKDLLIMLGAEMTAEELIVRTTKGKILITAEIIYIDGTAYSAEHAFDLILNQYADNPTPIYYYKTDTYQAFEEFINYEKASNQMIYSSAGIIGNYALTEDTLLASDCGNYGFHTSGIKLNHNMRYNATVYSKDGYTADVVIIDDPSAATIKRTEYIVVSEYDGSTLKGYIDGKPVSISANNLPLAIHPGDYASFTHINGRLISQPTIIASPTEYLSIQTMYASSTNTNASDLRLYAPVMNVVGNVLYNNVYNSSTGIETMYLTRITDDTKIYVYDWEQNTVVPGDITDITRYYFYSGNAADWVTVHSQNQIASTIVICKQ